MGVRSTAGEGRRDRDETVENGGEKGTGNGVLAFFACFVEGVGEEFNSREKKKRGTTVYVDERDSQRRKGAQTPGDGLTRMLPV